MRTRSLWLASSLGSLALTVVTHAYAVQPQVEAPKVDVHVSTPPRLTLSPSRTPASAPRSPVAKTVTAVASVAMDKAPALRTLRGMTPSSIQYAEYLGPHDPKAPMTLTVHPAGYRAAYGVETSPGPEVVAKISAWAKQSGFTVNVEQSGRSLSLSGPTAVVEKALHVKMNLYANGTGRERETYVSTRDEPTIPADLPIQSVFGLHRSMIRVPHAAQP